MNVDGENGRGLRDRIAVRTEEKIGRALSDLLESPLLSGAIGRAFDAREKAAQAQELAMGALNLPSAADIERLTRRLRSVSQRLEGIEDGVSRLERGTGMRLASIEEQLRSATGRLEELNAKSAEPASAEQGQKPAKPAPAASAAKAAKAPAKRPARRTTSRPRKAD